MSNNSAALAATALLGPTAAEERGGARVVARCDHLGTPVFSDEPDMLFRPYLGPAHAAAIAVLARWMEEAGMVVWVDAAGNLIGRYEGLLPDAKTLMIGSHIDSVRDGGRYDGPLGILLGIEVVAHFAALSRRFDFAIEVVAFGDEEGSRFHTSMLCSRAVAGTLGDQPLDLLSADGKSLQELLSQFRPAWPHVPLSVTRLPAARRASESLLAFVEAHIEQGPQLEAEDLALGIVTGISGQLRYKAKFQGKAAHAGTTSMALRRDALAAAAEAVLVVEMLAAAEQQVVATVGRLTVKPDAVNVVPGEVELSLDVRSGDMARRDAVAARILAAFEDIAARRQVGFALTPMQDLPATPCDGRLIETMGAALCELGLPDRRLTSGAGHDTMVMAAVVPTVMLFIRCAGGISHHPDEAIRVDDTELAFSTLIAFVERVEITG